MKKFNTIYCKSSGDITHAKDICQHNKGSLQQVYDQHKLSGEKKLKSILLKSGTRKCCWLSPHLYNIAIVARAVKQLK